MVQRHQPDRSWPLSRVERGQESRDFKSGYFPCCSLDCRGQHGRCESEPLRNGQFRSAAPDTRKKSASITQLANAARTTAIPPRLTIILMQRSLADVFHHCAHVTPAEEVSALEAASQCGMLSRQEGTTNLWKIVNDTVDALGTKSAAGQLEQDDLMCGYHLARAFRTGSQTRRLTSRSLCEDRRA